MQNEDFMITKLLVWDASVEGQKVVYGAEEKRFIIPYP